MFSHCFKLSHSILLTLPKCSIIGQETFSNTYRDNSYPEKSITLNNLMDEITPPTNTNWYYLFTNCYVSEINMSSIHSNINMGWTNSAFSCPILKRINANFSLTSVSSGIYTGSAFSCPSLLEINFPIIFNPGNPTAFLSGCRQLRKIQSLTFVGTSNTYNINLNNNKNLSKVNIIDSEISIDLSYTNINKTEMINIMNGIGTASGAQTFNMSITPADPYMLDINDRSTVIDKGYTFNSSMLSSELVLYLDAGNTNSYPGSGTTWVDIGGDTYPAASPNDGTISGATFNTDHFNFDGTNDVVTVGTDASLGFADSFTVGAIIEPLSLVGTQSIIGRYETTGKHNYSIDLVDGRLSYSFWDNGGSVYRTRTLNRVLETGQKYFVAVNYNSNMSNSAIWIDGVSDTDELVDTFTNVDAYNDPAASVSIGGDSINSDNFANMKIYAAFIWNKSLSSINIRTLNFAFKEIYNI